MKKLFLILALVCMSVGASAQEIYNEVKRIEKENGRASCRERV